MKFTHLRTITAEDIATWQPDHEPEAAKTKTYRCSGCRLIGDDQ